MNDILPAPDTLLGVMSALTTTDRPQKLGIGRVLGIEGAPIRLSVNDPPFQPSILVSGGKIPILDIATWSFPYHGTRVVFVFQWNIFYFAGILPYPAAPLHSLPDDRAEVWGPFHSLEAARGVLTLADAG